MECTKSAVLHFGKRFVKTNRQIMQNTIASLSNLWFSPFRNPLGPSAAFAGRKKKFLRLICLFIRPPWRIFFLKFHRAYVVYAEKGRRISDAMLSPPSAIRLVSRVCGWSRDWCPGRISPLFRSGIQPTGKRKCVTLKVHTISAN